jgi:hypothetical protein
VEVVATGRAKAEVTAPELMTTGLEVTHSGTIKWSRLDDGMWMVEVVATGGDIKTGLGDDLVSALLDLITYMLPPDHPEYPPK